MYVLHLIVSCQSSVLSYVSSTTITGCVVFCDSMLQVLLGNNSTARAEQSGSVRAEDEPFLFIKGPEYVLGYNKMC